VEGAVQVLPDVQLNWPAIDLQDVQFTVLEQLVQSAWDRQAQLVLVKEVLGTPQALVAAQAYVIPVRHQTQPDTEVQAAQVVLVH